jgi:hypothetical protein
MTLSSLAARIHYSPRAGSPAAERAALVIAFDGEQLIGTTLDRPPDSASPWRRNAVLSRGPLLAGGVVVYGDAARLTALDAQSGAQLWSIPSPRTELRAVADDGTSTVLVLDSPAEKRRWLAVYDRSARLLFRLEANVVLGLPALAGGSLLLPWDGQFLSAFDLPSGSELGRVRLDTPIDHALSTSAGLFLGGPPFVPFGRAGELIELPWRPLPGRVRAGASAGEKPGAEEARLYVWPDEDTDTDSYVVSQGRVAMGFERARGALLWVRVFPGLILGGAALPDAFALCDETGVLTWLGSRDADARQPLRLMRSRPGGLPGSGRGGRDSTRRLQACGVESGRVSVLVEENRRTLPAEPLIEQLSRVMALADPSLSESQRFLSRELAARPEPEATLALIQLATRRNADPILQAEAEDLLATRRNGTEYMLQALSRTGVFARDPSALPPVAALADALGALDEKQAAPLLAEQINHPGHSASAVARVAAALERLASESEYHELAVFFSLHHTTAEQPDRVRAVNSVARTLLRIGGDPGRALVQFAARDPLTVQDIREGLLRELGPGSAGGPHVSSQLLPERPAVAP